MRLMLEMMEMVMETDTDYDRYGHLRVDGLHHNTTVYTRLHMNK